MAHKDRKIRKMRGSRTCGYGSAQKHRGAGSRGGRGLAGSKKHKWSYISKYMPEHFGKRGFKRPKKLIKVRRIINIGDIEKCLDKFLSDGKVEKKGNSYIIDLKLLGYDKLLGSGKVIHKFIVKNVESCSKSAIKKIEETGGTVELIKK
ncbi:MAG: 50S ribosomal protein L15 [Candidatus Altiarchaeales archaeon]|nr:MAG: 50S ribosomal protein L15 [Candidatus Altiarchaeales archaeon]RLI95219.1 MAG: 50S ribosomal protein L15 [Candidatus Altiarchaeales archaeon]RLI95253.1 MAG: 50S ribosomal protein L15 [Candidatus Altiarchaeales archaeon]HDO82640.1 50S ribosomal protein L15 [Candidatus Altiarchaeales archaeon]HEX55289.1 50S ribosomal protein L15 [Candidatus Altiarchaeales archaeon]